MSASTEYDLQFEDVFDEFDDDEHVTGAEPSKPGEEMVVEIEHAQWDGETCAELYAHGVAYNDEMVKVQKRYC